ncbi:ATP-binding protein [Streptomyces sp. NPDC049597]|uniref:ATP-binding protein n=1 Tax=Streptomyces sp. NPDC049597 TaxID=3155276 RepID=UPI0034280FD2
MTAVKTSPAVFLSALERQDGVERATVEVKSEVSSVPLARRFARDCLAGWGFTREGDLTERVVLTVSELVTNAIQHARTRAAGEIELVVLSCCYSPGTALGVSVTDNSSTLPAIRPSSCDTRGRGLVLVSAEADCWTTTQSSAGGKEVWAFFCSPAAELCTSA